MWLLTCNCELSATYNEGNYRKINLVTKNSFYVQNFRCHLDWNGLSQWDEVYELTRRLNHFQANETLNFGFPTVNNLVQIGF